MLRQLTALSILSLLLASCSTAEGEFPSLAKRPYESEDAIAEPVATPDVVAASLPADLAAKLAEMEARHAKAEAAFRKMLPSVQAVANRAAGSAVGSEAWADANVKLSRLDYARAESVKVGREVDELVSAQRDVDAKSDQPAVTPLLEERQATLAAAIEAQDTEINRLGAMLGA